MRIVVLGAGTVGTSIAEMLCQNRHNVTVVDIDAEHGRRINEELDVRVVYGSASQSSVLFQSDISGADLCLAVTGKDEVNIVAASMAKEMGARRTIARVYSPVFRDLSTFDYERHFHIDRLLSLEHLSAVELARGVRNPDTVLVENFARGELEVLEVEVGPRASARGRSLKDLGLPKQVRIGSIYREGKMWIAGATDLIQQADRLTLIGRNEDIEEIKPLFHHDEGPKQGVVIAGGGETGLHLARILESERFDVVVMESSKERSQYLSKLLTDATVLCCDATRRAVLEEERVGSADYFVACTGDDENNIVAAVEAREIGVNKVLAVVGRPDYAGVVTKLGIDKVVSPRTVIARQVLGFLNTGPVISRSLLPGGRIGVFEIDVTEGAPATEHVLAALPLPGPCLIAAVIHKNYVQVPGADDRLAAGDTVVALIDDAVAEDALELFRVSSA